MSTSTISTVSDSVLAQMSKDAYNNPNEITPGNLSSEYTISYQTGDNGFKYAIYENTQNPNEIIIAYAGTDSPGDWISNVQMVIDQLPGQYTQALNTYNAIKNENPNANITITGHSLGGSLAQLVGAATGSNTVTFNPYGTSEIAIQVGINPAKKYDNIKNYNISSDILNIANNIKNVRNLGESFIIPSAEQNMIKSHGIDEIINYFNSDNKIASILLTQDWYNQNKEFCKKLEELGTVLEGNLNRIINAKTSIGLFLNSIIFAKDLSYFFYKAFNNNVKCDPLIFDLDGDGKISLTDLENGTNFDIDNDGFAQKISWVSGQDGILVLDRNN